VESGNKPMIPFVLRDSKVHEVNGLKDKKSVVLEYRISVVKLPSTSIHHESGSDTFAARTFSAEVQKMMLKQDREFDAPTV